MLATRSPVFAKGRLSSSDPSSARDDGFVASLGGASDGVAASPGARRCATTTVLALAEGAAPGGAPSEQPEESAMALQK
jgi:hypothetical protein